MSEVLVFSFLFTHFVHRIHSCYYYHRGRLILALAFAYVMLHAAMHARGRAFVVLHCTLMYCIVLEWVDFV
jgi:hypothetical protein